MIEFLRDHLLFAESIRNKSKKIIKKASDWIFEFDNKILM